LDGDAALQQALHDLGVSKVYHQSDIFKGNFADAPKWNAALEAKFAGGGQVFTKRDWDELLGDYAVQTYPVFCSYQQPKLTRLPQFKGRLRCPLNYLRR
jgi:hypothetical protein